MAGFLLQWGGAWTLARLAAWLARDRRWRVRWERAARALAPAAIAGAAAAALSFAYHGSLPHPAADELARILAALPAAAGFASLWSAARLEAGGQRRAARAAAWFGGVLASAGCFATALAGTFTAEPSPFAMVSLLGLGLAALLGGLARKPRPTGTLAAAGYVALSLATASILGGW